MKAIFTPPTTRESFARDIATFGLEGASRLAAIDGVPIEQVQTWAETLVHAPARDAAQHRADMEDRAAQRRREALRTNAVSRTHSDWLI